MPGPTLVDLKGKVVLITGASTGIGEACAHALSRRGARLVLTARSTAGLEQVSRAIAPAQASIVPADLRRPQDVTNLVERAIACHGRVDVLINNAGVGVYVSCWRVDPAVVREMMEVNFFAPLELIRSLVPHMQGQGGGTIVNVSSVAGKVALPWLTLYSASKAALNFLSDGLRMELRGTGIHVLSVCPGYVSTGFHQHVLAGEVPRAVANRRRFTITPQECAEAIVTGVEKEKRTIVTPGIAWVLVGLARVLPGPVDRVLGGMQGP